MFLRGCESNLYIFPIKAEDFKCLPQRPSFDVAVVRPPKQQFYSRGVAILGHDICKRKTKAR